MVGYDPDIYPAFFDMTKDSKSFSDRTVQTHEALIDASHAQMHGDYNEKPPSPHYGRIRPNTQPTRSTRTSLRGRGGRLIRGRGADRANSNGIDSQMTTFSVAEPNQTSSPTPNHILQIQPADNKPRSRSKSPNIYGMDSKTFQPNCESTRLKPSRSLDSFGGPSFPGTGNTVEPQSFEDDSEDRNINTSTINEPRVSQIDLDVIRVAIKNEDDSEPPPKDLRDRDLLDHDPDQDRNNPMDEPKSKRMKSEMENEQKVNDSCPSLEGSEEVKDEPEERNHDDIKNECENDLKIDDSEWPAEDQEKEEWEKSKENEVGQIVEEVGTKTDEMILESRFTYVEESTVESEPSGNLDGNENEEDTCKEQKEKTLEKDFTLQSGFLGGGGDGDGENNIGTESEMTLIPDRGFVEETEKDLYPPRAVDVRLGLAVNSEKHQGSTEVNSFNDSFERSPSRNNDDESYEDEGGSEDNVEDNEFSESISNRKKWRDSNAGK